MTKQSLVLKYFQKSDLLTVKNKNYSASLSSLFSWLTRYDDTRTDRTTRLLGLTGESKAVIISKGAGLIAGLEEINFLLKNHTPLKFQPEIKDGDSILNNQTVAVISGKTADILAFERTVLNILQRASGIASETKRLQTFINKYSPDTFLAATRKTPYMLLDKKAVSVGGGLTHRLSLSDGILIKDNHLKESGNITQVLKKIFGKIANDLVEIEVETPKQAFETVETFDSLNNHGNNLALMLDNFSPDLAGKTVFDIKKKYNLPNIIFEASGGIEEKNLKDFAQTGADIISIGSLTHSPRAANLSLEFLK